MKLRDLMIGVMAAALCACGDDESTAEAESPDSKRSVRSANDGRSYPKRSTNPSRSYPSRSPSDRPKTERSSPSEKPVAKLDPNLRLPRSAEERAERRAEREAEERAERAARRTEQIGSFLKDRDTNGDGLISKDELPGPFSGRFDDLDSNKDGHLDETEQAAMLEAITERMSRFGDRGRRRER